VGDHGGGHALAGRDVSQGALRPRGRVVDADELGGDLEGAGNLFCVDAVAMAQAQGLGYASSTCRRLLPGEVCDWLWRRISRWSMLDPCAVVLSPPLMEGNPHV
jgi:hypothetical protein